MTERVGSGRKRKEVKRMKLFIFIFNQNPAHLQYPFSLLLRSGTKTFRINVSPGRCSFQIIEAISNYKVPQNVRLASLVEILKWASKCPSYHIRFTLFDSAFLWSNAVDDCTQTCISRLAGDRT